MGSLWYRPAIAGMRAKTQNTNNVDDVRARFLARVDRSLQRYVHESDNAEASPVWAGLGPRVTKFNREVSVSHGHTSFSLQRTSPDITSEHHGPCNRARTG